MYSQYLVLLNIFFVKIHAEPIPTSINQKLQKMIHLFETSSLCESECTLEEVLYTI